MKTIAAKHINPHDVLVMDGKQRKVRGVIRYGYPTASVDIEFTDRAKINVGPDVPFDYLGDARIVGFKDC